MEKRVITKMTSKTARIGIDLDSTLADYMASAIPLLKEHYGLEPKYDKAAYSIEEVFGLTSETRPPDMRKVLYEDLRLFRDLAPLEEDNHLLTKKLADGGAKIYIVTARTPTPIVVEDTHFWLQENGFVYDDVFFTGQKDTLCSLMRMNAMVEDELGQVYRLIRAGINVVMLDHPWNRRLGQAEYFETRHDGKDIIGTIRGAWTRVYNWRDALRVLEEYLP